MRFITFVSTFVSFFSFLFWVVRCGSPSNVSYTYNGPGTNWSMTLSGNGNFQATETVNRVNALGTFVRNSAGFDVITIPQGGITGTNLPTGASAGYSFYALEVPGVGLFAPPILTGETQLLTAVLGGACPHFSFNGNYIYTQFTSGDNLTSTGRDWFGTFQYRTLNGGATASLSTSGLYNLATYTTSGAALSSQGSCLSGNYSSSTATAYTMQGGGFVTMNYSGNTDGALVLPQGVIPSTSSLNGKYHGLYVSGALTTLSLTPVAVTMTSTGGTLSNLSTTTFQAISNNFATITVTTLGPSTGFFEMTVGNQGSGVGSGICMYNQNILNSFKNTIFCLAEDPNNTANPVNILLVSN